LYPPESPVAKVVNSSDTLTLFQVILQLAEKHPLMLASTNPDLARRAVLLQTWIAPVQPSHKTIPNYSIARLVTVEHQMQLQVAVDGTVAFTFDQGKPFLLPAQYKHLSAFLTYTKETHAVLNMLEYAALETTPHAIGMMIVLQILIAEFGSQAFTTLDKNMPLEHKAIVRVPHVPEPLMPSSSDASGSEQKQPPAKRRRSRSSESSRRPKYILQKVLKVRTRQGQKQYRVEFKNPDKKQTQEGWRARDNVLSWGPEAVKMIEEFDRVTPVRGKGRPRGSKNKVACLCVWVLDFVQLFACLNSQGLPNLMRRRKRRTKQKTRTLCAMTMQRRRPRGSPRRKAKQSPRRKPRSLLRRAARAILTRRRRRRAASLR
jgi:hypothetical protein